MTLNTGIRIVGLDEARVSMPVVAYISRAQLDTAVLQPQLDAALLHKIAWYSCVAASQRCCKSLAAVLMLLLQLARLRQSNSDAAKVQRCCKSAAMQPKPSVGRCVYPGVASKNVCLKLTDCGA